MNESDYQELLETSWRRSLTPAEEARLQAYLAEHPQAQATWESEAGLNHLLNQLPDVPLASNFTSLVLQAVDREAARPARSFAGLDWIKQLLERPLPKLAWAAALVVLGVLGLLQFESVKREKMADGLVRLDHAASTLDPKLLEDFDAIRTRGQASSPSDDILFAVMNQSQ